MHEVVMENLSHQLSLRNYDYGVHTTIVRQEVIQQPLLLLVGISTPCTDQPISCHYESERNYFRSIVNSYVSYWIFQQCEKSKKGEVLFLANFCFKAGILGSVVHKNMMKLKDKPFCLAFVDLSLIKKLCISVALKETFRYLELYSTCLKEGLGRSKPATNP